MYLNLYLVLCYLVFLLLDYFNLLMTCVIKKKDFNMKKILNVMVVSRDG